jgi:hypothetical protein
MGIGFNWTRSEDIGGDGVARRMKSGNVKG